MTNEPGDDAQARPFGLATATFVVVASMVGTGVLTTSGFTVHYTGSNQIMLALWVLGGVVALCGALSLAELGAALPRSGGDYVFLLEAFGAPIAFLSGWVSLLIGFGGPIALSASASAQYLLEPLHMAPAVARLAIPGLATVAILILAVIHSAGHAPSRNAQAATTITKLCILCLLAAVGLAVAWRGWRNLDDRPRLQDMRWTDMLFSLVYISYAYTGWNGAGYIAGEVHNPRRLVPRAILLGTGAVTLLYLALNMFYALALPVAEIHALVKTGADGREDTSAIVQVAGLAAGRAFGAGWRAPLSVALGITLLASLSAYVMTGPRVACAMAHAGQFPAVAGRVSRTGAPAVATWIQVLWSLVLLWTGSYQSIMEYSSVGLALISMFTVTSVFVLRHKRPELPRPFRVPGHPLVPGFYLLVTSLLCAAAFWQKPLESGLALACMVLGLPVFWLWRFARRRQSSNEPPGSSTTGSASVSSRT